MLSSETFGGGQYRTKRLSRAELQKIKKNMKKVPLIQEKSTIYHAQEAKKAEEFLQNMLEKQKHENGKITHIASPYADSDMQHSRLTTLLRRVKTILGL